MNNITILTVTYDKDLPYLKYNLKSIEKFCNNYFANIVIVDDHEDDCVETVKYLEEIGQPYVVDTDAKHVRRGYVRQQYMKLLADKHAPAGTEYISHVDSDSIFLQPHDTDLFFIDGKPMLLYSDYQTIYDHIRETRPPEMATRDIKAFQVWQELTSRFVKQPMDLEYMATMPLVYPIEIHRLVREKLEDLHEMSLLNLLKDEPIISEFNLIGAVSDLYFKDYFSWVDKNKDPYFETFIKQIHSIYGHYSSREKEQPLRYVDLSCPDNPISRAID